MTTTDNSRADALTGLLPCPFCGGEPKRMTLSDEANFGGDVIVCTKCECSTHVEFGEKSGLVDAWNSRVAHSRSPAMAAEAVVIPAGWKLVPVEPTIEMLMFTYDPGASETPSERYSKLLAAAPQPPAPAATPASAHIADATEMVLTDEQIISEFYLHTVIDDEPLFTFDRQSAIALARALLQGANHAE